MEKIAFRAMGCDMLAALDRDGPAAAAKLRQVPQWFENWEQHFSRFRPDSELSRINRTHDRDVRISRPMQEVLRAALRASRQSGGLVTPALLDEIQEAGYDRSFSEIEVRQPAHSPAPAPAGIRLAYGPSRVDSIRLHADKVRLTGGVRLDLGGIAKGWAADRAVRLLRQSGPSLVDAGGDIAVNGPMSDGSPWPVGVIDPYDFEKRLDVVMLPRGGIATSGKNRRRWLLDRVWKHHIIDPRSGQPAQTDVLTATVIGPSAQAAEIAAKVILISGSYQGTDWLEERPELAGLIVLDDGEVVYSRRWLQYSYYGGNG